VEVGIVTPGRIISGTALAISLGAFIGSGPATAAVKPASPEACAAAAPATEDAFRGPDRAGFSEWAGADRSYVKPQQLVTGWSKDNPSLDLATRYSRSRPVNAIRACPELAASLRIRGAVVGNVEIRGLVPQQDTLTGKLGVLQVYSLTIPVLAEDGQSALMDAFIGDGCRVCTRQYIFHLRRSAEGQWTIVDQRWVLTGRQLSP
jgi:hypothetical protein